MQDFSTLIMSKATQVSDMALSAVKGSWERWVKKRHLARKKRVIHALEAAQARDESPERMARLIEGLLAKTVGAQSASSAECPVWAGVREHTQERFMAVRPSGSPQKVIAMLGALREPRSLELAFESWIGACAQMAMSAKIDANAQENGMPWAKDAGASIKRRTWELMQLLDGFEGLGSAWALAAERNAPGASKPLEQCLAWVCILSGNAVNRSSFEALPGATDRQQPWGIPAGLLARETLKGGAAFAEAVLRMRQGWRPTSSPAPHEGAQAYAGALRAQLDAMSLDAALGSEPAPEAPAQAKPGAMRSRL